MIEFYNISKTYHTGKISVKALKGINLKIKEGEFVAIVGPSGSGKSTLMNIMGCLDRPSGGEYFLNGQKVSEMNDRQLARVRNREIGFVFQKFNLLPRLNAFENVELPLIYQGVPARKRKKMVEEVLEIVGLLDRQKHKPAELSGGQQQRVAIARALVTRPSIILADEPTGALDSVTGREIINYFVKLNSQGKTVVLITHDLDIAQIAKRRVYLRDGKIEKDEKVSS